LVFKTQNNFVQMSSVEGGTILLKGHNRKICNAYFPINITYNLLHKKVIKLQIEKLLWHSASIVPVPPSSEIPRNIGTYSKGHKTKWH
jgi:hypothetical protein